MFGTIKNGSVTVGTTAVQVFSALPTSLSNVLVYIVADPSNTANIYIGRSDVTAGKATPTTDGICLSPISPPLVMAVKDISTIYARSSSASQAISYIVNYYN